MSENNFQLFRFVHDMHEMIDGGTLITDEKLISYWRKRFIYMEWMIGLTPAQLEIVLIGRQDISAPFYNYTPDYLKRLQAYYKNIVSRHGFVKDKRTFLVEELYPSADDAMRSGVVYGK